jgi:hypothetical protein
MVHIGKGKGLPNVVYMSKMEESVEDAASEKHGRSSGSSAGHARAGQFEYGEVQTE